VQKEEVMQMRHIVGRALAGLTLALAVSAAWAVGQPKGTVVIGQVTCFRIRVPDKGETIQQRLDRIQDVAAKHLGGDDVTFAIRPVGERRHIDVNGEFLVAVTPEDARATGHKSAATLAPVWKGALERAFLQSRARPAPPAVTQPQPSENK
jgi:hypothetical protein